MSNFSFRSRYEAEVANCGATRTPPSETRLKCMADGRRDLSLPAKRNSLRPTDTADATLASENSTM
jgi:hypothetical protein